MDDGWPDPALAGTAAEFVEALRALKRASGLGYRSLEKASAGALPRSTLTAVLARDRLPRADLVEALVRACGLDEEQVARWLAQWRRLAGTDTHAGDHPESGTSARDDGGSDSGPVGPTAVEPTAPARRSVLADLVPPLVRTGSWPLRVMAGVFALVIVVVVAGAVVAVVRDLAGSSTGSSGSSGDVAAPDGPPAEQSVPPGSTASGAGAAGGGWSVYRQGRATLPDEQRVDFETMTIGPDVPGWDLMLSNRGVKLSAPKGVTILDTPGPAGAEPCSRSTAGNWDTQAGPANTLTAGGGICVATDGGRAVLLTVVRAPDSVTPDLVFDYVVWQRPAP
jgi:hypothetical protein